jgi:hypothetical protein
MNKQEQHEEENDPIVYVYIPDEQLNGFVIKHGAYVSTIQYFDNGVGYIVEMPNDEFIVVDEIGIGHVGEEEEDL